MKYIISKSEIFDPSIQQTSTISTSNGSYKVYKPIVRTATKNWYFEQNVKVHTCLPLTPCKNSKNIVKSKDSYTDVHRLPINLTK